MSTLVAVGSSIAFTQRHERPVQLRTVSVRPSRYRRVIDDSYVWQKRF